MKLVVALLLALSFSNSYAQPITGLGDVDCPTTPDGIEVGYCTYTLKVNTGQANVIVSKVQQALFQGFPLVHPVGILAPFGGNNSAVIFWHQDAVMLAKMKAIMPSMDVYEEFAPTKVYKVKVDVIQMTREALTSLSADITSLAAGTSTGPKVGLNGTGLELNLQLGAVQLSALLQAQKAKGNIYVEETQSKVITNLSSIQFSSAAVRNTVPGIGASAVEEHLGMEVDGVLSQSSLDNNIIQIRDMRFTYSRLRDDGLIHSIDFPYNNFTLSNGVATPVFVHQIKESQRTSRFGISGLGTSGSKKYTHIVAYVTVTAMDHNEYQEELRTTNNVIRTQFSEDERTMLPGNCPEMRDVLKDLKLGAAIDEKSGIVLNFGINKKNACTGNIDKIIKVTVTGTGIKRRENTQIIPLEQFMLVPSRIKSIDPSKMNKSKLNFTVTLEFEGLKISHDLVYLPSTMNLDAAFYKE